MIRSLSLVLIAALLIAGCGTAAPVASLPTPAEAAQIATSLPPSATPPPSATATATPSPTGAPTATASPTATLAPTATPEGCQRPPDDTTQVLVRNEYLLNARTIAMLEHAQELYSGDHDFILAVTQGSYHPGVSASFGTHDGGGAVDLSVRDLNDWNHVLYEEMDDIILALRRAGFAAWLRDTGDLYADSPVHIHAIAIGDPDLSEAAQEQLTGVSGYFYGYDGLPVDPPQADRHGGPVVCPWMIEMGYPDEAVGQ